MLGNVKEKGKKILILITIIMLLTQISIKIFEIKNNKNLKSILKNNLDGYQNINTEYEEIYNEVEQKGGIETIENEIVLQTKISNENKEQIISLNKKIEELNRKNIFIEEELINLKQQSNNEFVIERKITYNQFPLYPTGCESVALYILLKYNDIEITVDEIINELKKGELPYTISGSAYGGNPEKEFIGDPRNDYSYGVYNEPLKQIALKYKDGIISKIGMEFEEMLNIVKEKRPVLVWTTINLTLPYISQSWIYKPTGEIINWISGEHAVVVIGYNDTQIIVSDPYTGTIRYLDKELFKNRYNYLGKRVLYY